MSARGARRHLPTGQTEDTLKRLTQRFASWSSLNLSEAEALHQVSGAVGRYGAEEGDEPEVTAEDTLDALALAGPAMFYLEVSELKVMAYARHVLRIEWEQIGLRMGYEPSAAKQGAQARYARLSGRYPWVAKQIKQQSAPAVVPVEQGDEQQ